MRESELAQRSDLPERSRQAQAILADLFENAGWQVHREPEGDRHSRPDLIIQRKGFSYAVEVKAAAEGRSDRLIPLWAQAYLQASHAGSAKRAALAVVAAPRISSRIAEQILKFAAEYAPSEAVGVIDFRGLRRFRGRDLEGLDSEGAHLAPRKWSAAGDSAELFSDLNQWMLKVLLAPELPPRLLSAPRESIHNARQLAKAANVSVMSAYRFAEQLQRENYLHESASKLSLVRREDLFLEWQSSAVRRVRQVPMRFLLGGRKRGEMTRSILRDQHACLALFAAAEALGVGFVHGVPPYIYVHRLDPENVAAWRNLIPAERGEAPDIILRQAPAPQSVFRGAVMVDQLLVCDVIQVWLDVSSHPSRGQEQAKLIRRRILDEVIGAKHSG